MLKFWDLGKSQLQNLNQQIQCLTHQREAGKIQMAKLVNSNLVNQIEDLIKKVKLSDINLPLKKCDLTHADYTKLGFWTGSGDKNCTDSKILNSEAPVKIEG